MSIDHTVCSVCREPSTHTYTMKQITGPYSLMALCPEELDSFKEFARTIAEGLPPTDSVVK